MSKVKTCVNPNVIIVVQTFATRQCQRCRECIFFFSFCKYTFTNEQEQSCVSKLMFDVVNEISRVMFV